MPKRFYSDKGKGNATGLPSDVIIKKYPNSNIGQIGNGYGDDLESIDSRISQNISKLKKQRKSK